MRRHGEPARARSRGAAALLLWVGSRERATLLPKCINHRSDLPLILTISLSDACKRRLYSAPKESTPLPGKGRLLFLSRWGRNFAAAAARRYTRARRRMPCRMRVPERGRLPSAWCRTCSYAQCPHCRDAGTGQRTSASASRLFPSKSHWVALSTFIFFLK